ncbi:MAG TPA: TldD/PmbA family protein [Candidatus Goldiibacteriota bacterium]|nr:TldD/PmbA family protein [Candidatus Goldiibacteriota bacterium]
MEDVALSVLGLAKENGVMAEIYTEENDKSEALANDGSVEKISSSVSFGACVRVFREGKIGSSFFTVKKSDSAREAFYKALEAAIIEGYENYQLPGKTELPKTNCCDPAHDKLDLDKLSEAALMLEAACLSEKKVKFARDATINAEKRKVSLYNTAGFSGSHESTYYRAFVSAIASDSGSQETADVFQGTGLFSAIDPEALGREASKRASLLLGGKPVKSGTYRLILPPHTASDFVGLLSKLFLADYALKGKSLLSACSQGDNVASGCVTIIDDPLLEYCAGSRPFDDEGTPSAALTLVDKGKFNGFIYDIMSAQRAKKSSSGGSLRPDFKSLPECGPSNFYIMPKSGSCSGETGIEVNSLMGLHMTDTISGNFSLSANGWTIERGERKMPVREILITGNIKELLMNIEAVCDDLKFFGKFGSPTLIIGGIKVAGS